MNNGKEPSGRVAELERSIDELNQTENREIQIYELIEERGLGIIDVVVD